jgi:hypothetical protein
MALAHRPALVARARRLHAALAIGALGALAGCGSAGVAHLPASDGPPRDVAALARGRSVILLGRERVVELRDTAGRVVGRAPAGVGPAHVACIDRGGERAWCYVTDTRGNALLVFAVGARIEPRRRLYLAGGPDRITVDHVRRRLLVTFRAGGAIAELPAHGRPHVLRRGSPTR